MSEALEILDPRLSIGGNSPPSEYATIQARIVELTATANRWIAERPIITDAAMATKAKDFIDQVTAEISAAEAERVAEKEPHLSAGRAVDEKFRTLVAPLTIIKPILAGKRDAWLRDEQTRLDNERRAAAQEAQRIADEAAEAARAAQAPTASVETILAAQDAEKRATDAQKAAEAIPERAQIQSGMGWKATGLRTSWIVTLTDWQKAARHFKDDPSFIAELGRLAAAEVRGMKSDVRTVPGFIVTKA